MVDLSSKEDTRFGRAIEIMQRDDDGNLVSDQRPAFLYVKMNNQEGAGGDSSKNQKEIKVKLSESTNSVAEFIIEDVVKKHMNSRGKTYPTARLYSKNGVELLDDDILYMKSGDVVYLARHGEGFNYQQVLDRYERLDKLGSGGFGKVYLMRDKENPSQLYAVKIISMNEYMQKADGIYEIDREAKTMRMLNSKYIIQLENYFIHGQKEVILVMEYARGGELKQYLNKKPKHRISEQECQFLMRQIVTGLASCHQRGIIHRDLKLENILFYDKEQTHLKIVDFGIAGFCLKHLKEKTDAGTFKYMAPEVLKGEINLANPSMDIWALGIMMFLMLYGFHPFLTKQERLTKQYEVKTVVQRIINDPIEIPLPRIEKQTSGIDEAYGDEDGLSGFVEKESEILEVPLISDDCRSLLERLLEKNPRQRIQLLDVQDHSWFSLTDGEIEKKQKELVQRMQDEEAQKQERQKLKFNLQISKRQTLQIPTSQSFGISSMKQPGKSPLGHNFGSTNGAGALGRKHSNVVPIEEKKDGKKKPLLKAFSQLDPDGILSPGKKKQCSSPALRKEGGLLKKQ